MSEYIQIGVTALRGPDGRYLPAVPLYIRAEDRGKAAAIPPLQEQQLVDELARKWGEYLKERREEHADD